MSQCATTYVIKLYYTCFVNVIEYQDTAEIHKKINRDYFELIASGQKTFEYRANDFECNPGDVLVLEEYEYENGFDDTINRRPTGRVIRKKVGYVAKTMDFSWLNRPDVKKAFEENGAQIISLLDE